MSVYECQDIYSVLKNNPYPGRGIILGKNSDFAVAAYFIMGRSANSRNRTFKQEGEDITIYPYDASKVEDPSLIIYSPVRKYGSRLIVTNGDQTDTVYDYISRGRSFEEALATREFEPDAPNFTPRISGMMTFEEGGFSYKMSILKSADEKGGACARYTFSYPSVDGVGHFISTYNSDGSPLPTFTGEPKRVALSDNLYDFSEKLWQSLNADNKISLYVSYTDIRTGSMAVRVFNKYE